MIAFQLSVNGKPAATAGVTRGVISAIATWVNTKGGMPPESLDDEWYAEISLGGLDKDSSEHLEWYQQALEVGDEVTLKVVEIEEIDEPDRRKRDTKTSKAPQS